MSESRQDKVIRTRTALVNSNAAIPYEIIVNLFTLPSSKDNDKPAITIAPATGVPQRFYFGFAEYLASRGNTVLTIDHPFLGESFPANVDTKSESARTQALIEAGDKVTMRKDWVMALELAILYLHSLYPNKPLVHVGNSNGGHILILTPTVAQLVTRVLYVSCFHPWTAFYPPEVNRQDSIDWIEREMNAKGYYPAKLLNLGENLTSGCGKDWNEWCGHRDYHLFDQVTKAKEFNKRLLAIYWSDDFVGSLQMSDQAMLSLPNAHATRLHIYPKEVGQETIGHTGSFRKNQKDLWNACFIDFIEKGQVPNNIGEKREFLPGSARVGAKL